MKRVLVVFGTRPEIIKLAPLIRKLLNDSILDVYTCFTGQHKEMALPLISFFDLKVDYDLKVMNNNQGLNDLCHKLFLHIDRVLNQLTPDVVIVQGDTTSAMVGALSAFHRKIKIAHVEAGLRSFNKYSPFPEEINRVIISKVADFNFAPTEIAKQNLLKENIDNSTIWVVGNTIVDAMYLTLDIINNNEYIRNEIDSYFTSVGINLDDLDGRIIVVTTHRRENFGENMINICNAISHLASKYKEMLFVIPVHMNPNVRNVIYNLLNGIENVRLLEPLPYPYFIRLISKAFLILTDSGGVQEEAPSFGVPVMVLRDVTERIEGINAGISKLIGTNPDRIIREVSEVIDDAEKYNMMIKIENPYGDGRACERITGILYEKLC